MSSSKILLVDDEPANCETLALILKRHGYEIAAFQDGWQAIEAARQEVFDTLVADIIMPTIDGISLAHRLRELQPHLRLILISGLGAIDYQLGNLDAALFYKPVNIKNLLEHLQMAHACGDVQPPC